MKSGLLENLPCFLRFRSTVLLEPDRGAASTLHFTVVFLLHGLRGGGGGQEARLTLSKSVSP